MHRQPIRRHDKLIEPQRRDPENLRDRKPHFGDHVVRQTALEIAQDRIPALAPDADDVGKAELGAIGVVDLGEGVVFGL